MPRNPPDNNGIGVVVAVVVVVVIVHVIVGITNPMLRASQEVDIHLDPRIDRSEGENVAVREGLVR